MILGRHTAHLVEADLPGMCLSDTSANITGVESPQPHHCAGLVQQRTGGGYLHF